MKREQELDLTENMRYHLKKGIAVSESVFRMHSDSYYLLIQEARKLYDTEYFYVSPLDRWLFENTDFGLFDTYEGNIVPLDCPYMINEESDEKVELNKPKRGGTKKFYVYVKDPSTGNVKKVSWGDTTGLKVKIDDPEARKSFAARHKCALQTDKTTAAYWACRLPYYAKQLGLSGGGNYFW